MQQDLNLEATLERIENDRERLKDLYKIALEEFPKWDKRLSEVIKQKDMDTIKKVAHSYKGSTATLGADLLHAMFLEMEHAARDNDLVKVEAIYTDEFPSKIEALEQAIHNFIES